jgi:hypothetical protein
MGKTANESRWKSDQNRLTMIGTLAWSIPGSWNYCVNITNFQRSYQSCIRCSEHHKTTFVPKCVDIKSSRLILTRTKTVLRVLKVWYWRNFCTNLNAFANHVHRFDIRSIYSLDTSIVVAFSQRRQRQILLRRMHVMKIFPNPSQGRSTTEIQHHWSGTWRFSQSNTHRIHYSWWEGILAQRATNFKP